MNWKNWKRIGLVMLGFCVMIGGIRSYRSWREEQFLPIEKSQTVLEPYGGNKTVQRAKPLGMVTGIYVKTSGVLVLDVADIYAEQGGKSPAKGVLERGDYLVALNGKRLKSKEMLTKLLDKSKGKMVTFQIRRNGCKKVVKVKPIKQGAHYRLGAWVRDDLAGLGTITLCSEENEFAALGHCISDMDLNEEVCIRQGSIHPCRITDIRKGKTDAPGALIGYIDYQPESPVGMIRKNTRNGISGKLFSLPHSMREVPYLPIAKRREVHTGKATFYNDFDGKRKRYQLKITHINHFNRQDSKGFVVEITDRNLIAKIGGIVQGLSGSPIVQDGKIVGAITHVFVHSPQRGYGIFVEDMLK